MTDPQGFLALEAIYLCKYILLAHPVLYHGCLSGIRKKGNDESNRPRRCCSLIIDTISFCYFHGLKMMQMEMIGFVMI